MRVTCSEDHETVDFGSDREADVFPECPVCDAVAELQNAEDIIRDLEDERDELREELANVSE